MNLTKEQALARIENLKKFIEDIDKPKLPELINGHFYQGLKKPWRPEDVYIYSKQTHTLTALQTGDVWNVGNGWGSRSLKDNNYDWKDVTQMAEGLIRKVANTNEHTDKPKLPELINGHWYSPTESEYYSDSVYVYVSIIDTLVDLEGWSWREGRGFNDETGRFGWVDVTGDHKIRKFR